ncbi:DUF3100 domain-containing protein [Curtobacterium pusillum]|uniref:DUF3100 domain-containing protein n=1 Tax=Curtobacterium pusillum TaxID=69373 RepID=A0ABX2M7T2_9MICO|nr:DUF3100 domain-containing protein [Curtobacterium pusillum]NUU13659.1 DUF3100 domain-containing protein [Curtobacterium pusillum]GLK30757.1 hypothetical protein GCM10017610_10420 [Curtobacterium pusillum]
MTDTAAPAPTAGRTTAPAPRPARTPRRQRVWIVLVLLLVIASLAQIVGPAVIPIGVASITVLPMVWGLLAGGVVSSQRFRPLGVDLQRAASAVMGIAVLLLIARLSVTIGPNIGLLVDAGPALLLQEVGHLFGTIVLALPLAVLLRMGRATIGATFSIDREGSFAMVSERFGPDSDEYRGTLSMYVFGTLLGAVVITIVASFATSLHVFDPLALAMGAGVGSGSMMAAAVAAVVAEHPGMQEQVLALAATSNLITGLLGMYVGMYVALPLAQKVYERLTRRATVSTAGTTARTVGAAPLVVTAATDVGSAAATEAPASGSRVRLLVSLPALVVVGTVVSSIAAGGFTWQIPLGYVLMCALVLIGLGVYRLTRGKIASLIVVTTVGALVTSPVSPIGPWLVDVLNTVDFLSICTVVLTIAGLSLGKDLPKLRSIGWKIVPVGLVAIVTSYLLSVVVAEFALGLWH